MRIAMTMILALLGLGLFIGSITMNWPSSTAEFGSPDIYDVGWMRYTIAIAFSIMALLVYWLPDFVRIWRKFKFCEGGDKYQRLMNQGIGYKENKKRKNPWPKHRLH